MASEGSAGNQFVSDFTTRLIWIEGRAQTLNRKSRQLILKKGKPSRWRVISWIREMALTTRAGVVVAAEVRWAVAMEGLAAEVVASTIKIGVPLNLNLTGGCHRICRTNLILDSCSQTCTTTSSLLLWVHHPCRIWECPKDSCLPQYHLWICHRVRCNHSSLWFTRLRITTISAK